MFYKFKKGIFVIIHDGKLVLFLPFSNHDYINNWYDKIYFSLEEKKLLEIKNYSSMKKELNQHIQDFMHQHPDQFPKIRGVEKLIFEENIGLGMDVYFVTYILFMKVI